MKKYSYGLVILLCLLSPLISQAAEPESAIVVQKSLETIQLNKILEKDISGNFLPINLISNGLLEKDVKLSRAGQKIQVFENMESSLQYSKSTKLELQKLRIKKKKSVLRYDYGGKKVRIALKKSEGDWQYRSIYIKKGKGSYYLDIRSIK